MKKFLIALTALVIVVAGLSISTPVSAASTTATTITEAQANSAYAITNPYRRPVSSRNMDFQPGQIVISTSMEYRNGVTANLVTTIVPVVSNGRLSWTVTSRTRNGESVPNDVITQISTSINTSWRNWVKARLPVGRITSITIDDTQIVVVTTK